MGVDEVSNSNQVKKQRLNKQISTTQKGNRKLAKSCKCAILVSDCLGKTCQAQAGYNKKQREKVKNAKFSRVLA